MSYRGKKEHSSLNELNLLRLDNNPNWEGILLNIWFEERSNKAGKRLLEHWNRCYLLLHHMFCIPKRSRISISVGIEPESSLPWSWMSSASSSMRDGKSDLRFDWADLPRRGRSAKISGGTVPSRLFSRSDKTVISLFELQISNAAEVENQEHSCSFDSHFDAIDHSHPLVE